jgi:hypothetical protein
MTQAQLRAAQRNAYNRGYKDALNNRAKSYAGIPLHLLFYYDAGHDEAQPKRLVPTTVLTPSGPITELCTLERAMFLQSANRHVPGGRR